MKREWTAAALLALLFALSLLNIAYLDRLIGEIGAELAVSQSLAESGRFVEAEQALDRAVTRWVEANSYTHIFLRHPEIDSTSDAFFELKQLLAEENAEGFPSAFDKLIYHLHSIDEMEHLRLGSIF